MTFEIRALGRSATRPRLDVESRGTNGGHMTRRREFLTTTALGTAGLSLGLTARGHARILGANDRVVVASIGIRGQGNALKQGFARLPNVEIKTLCDIDENLFAARANDPKLADVPTFRPGYQKDLRRVFEDKDIDAVVIATPNHWHALATIWALQAGKHVFVEKPASHNVREGRRMVEATRKYKKIVQTGFMNRSRPTVRDAIRFIHEGGIGDVYMARGLCFKPRPPIGRYPDGPLKPGEEYRLNVESKEIEPTWDAAYLSKVDYDLWQGPAPAAALQPQPLPLQLALALGLRQRRHRQPGTAPVRRGALGPQGRLSSRARLVQGGLYASRETSQETPDVQTSCFEYADGRVLEFATRGTPTNDEGSQRIGNLFYGTKGWVYIDGDGRKWQSYLGRKDEKGPGSDASAASASGGDPNVLTSSEGAHYQNFVDAVRAGDPTKLTCEIEEGHLSTTLPHIANIAYRLRSRPEVRRQDRDLHRRRRGQRAPDRVSTARPSPCPRRCREIALTRARGRVPFGLLVFGLMLPATVPAQHAKSGVQVVRHDADRRVDVVIDGQPFTSYIWPEALTKPVLYPLRTEKGTAVTRGFPLDPRPGERTDHPHHVGLWLSYGDVNGVDFWNNSTRPACRAAGQDGPATGT